MTEPRRGIVYHQEGGGASTGIGAGVEKPKQETGLGIDFDMIAGLVAEAKEAVIEVAQSNKTADELIASQEKAKKRIEKILGNKEFMMMKAKEKYGFDIKQEDLRRLAREKMISPQDATVLANLDEMIIKLEAEKPSEGSAKIRLDTLKTVRTDTQGIIEKRIEAEAKRMREERDALSEKLIAHYDARVKEQQDVIDEIATKPEVAARLASLETQKQERLKRIVDEHNEQAFQDAIRHLQSLRDKHNEAFARIEELTGIKDASVTLRELMAGEDKSAWEKACEQILGSLKTAIFSGAGKKKLVSPKEVVPWLKNSTIKYGEAIRVLTEDRTRRVVQMKKEAGHRGAVRFIDERNKAIAENRVFDALFGKRIVIEGKKRKEEEGLIWGWFAERDAQAKKLQEEADQKAKETKETIEAAKQAEIKEIVALGGVEVEFPTHKKLSNGRVIQTGYDRGAILLEKQQSKAGKDILRVTMLSKGFQGISVGKDSPLDMKSFPLWLVEELKKKGYSV